jgi:hypothetical protein
MKSGLRAGSGPGTSAPGPLRDLSSGVLVEGWGAEDFNACLCGRACHPVEVGLGRIGRAEIERGDRLPSEPEKSLMAAG